MIEAAVVLDEKLEPIYWHVPSDRSGGAIPDSKDLWQFIWENKDKVFGIAHTHPGRGAPRPSNTDLTTFQAIELALGRCLFWYILSQDVCTMFRWSIAFDGTDGVYSVFDNAVDFSGADLDRPWMTELRKLSNY
jgi:hypothetical protein